MLFSFLIPYRRFTAHVLAAGVSRYLSEPTSYRKLADEIAAREDEAPQRPNHGQLWIWVDLLVRSAANVLMLSVLRSCVRAGLDNLDSLIVATDAECANALKAHSPEKSDALNAGAKLLGLVRCLVHGTVKSADPQADFQQFVQSLLHFVTGRGIRLSAPHSSQHALF